MVGHDDIASRIASLSTGSTSAHPLLGVRDRIDVLVHLDAPNDVLADWYLARFQQLRTAAREDETAMLYPYRDMDPAALDGMAMQVWRDLNSVVIDEEIRPLESEADIVVRLGPDHEVLELSRR